MPRNDTFSALRGFSVLANRAFDRRHKAVVDGKAVRLDCVLRRDLQNLLFSLRCDNSRTPGHQITTSQSFHRYAPLAVDPSSRLAVLPSSCGRLRLVTPARSPSWRAP